MNCFKYLALAGAVSLVLSSCEFVQGRKDYDRQLARLQAQLDSVNQEKAVADSISARMEGYLDAIAESLDSIKIAEGVLTINVDENGRRLPKNEIIDNLNELTGIIARQRAKINELEGKIKNSPDSTSQYITIINSLKQQLAAKENEIAQLKATLSSHEARIGVLTSQVEDLEGINEEQATVIDVQTNILRAQDAYINRGFVLMKTKRELKSMGLLKLGKLVSENINPDDFQELNIRDFRELTISASKVKILSMMPSGSYTITKDGDSFTLSITDPASFWSLTNFLVIQLN